VSFPYSGTLDIPNEKAVAAASPNPGILLISVSKPLAAS
jgi:hypothetical protein